jgi:hypothetical protein
VLAAINKKGYVRCPANNRKEFGRASVKRYDFAENTAEWSVLSEPVFSESLQNLPISARSVAGPQ